MSSLATTTTRTTWTGPHVARFARLALTVRTAIRRRRLTASAGVSPVATSCGAGAVRRPSAVHCRPCYAKAKVCHFEQIQAKLTVQCCKSNPNKTAQEHSYLSGYTRPTKANYTTNASLSLPRLTVSLLLTNMPCNNKVLDS